MNDSIHRCERFGRSGVPPEEHLRVRLKCHSAAATYSAMDDAVRSHGFDGGDFA
ncbi:hypothetical protein [Haladaptatus litoreus]|uniref:hypothetical protein n=1 Tax=Haladaptatus litoreus TaxID=553468 RepID=UPI00158939D3|nr:hypothetical protein [Haladaptatus litoreus]